MNPHNLTRDELLNQITTTPLEKALHAHLEEATDELASLEEELRETENSADAERRTLDAALEKAEKEIDRLTALLELV
jgi:septal ring factor EnvC (AmiA/AmiB activator)